MTLGRPFDVVQLVLWSCVSVLVSCYQLRHPGRPETLDAGRYMSCMLCTVVPVVFFLDHHNFPDPKFEIPQMPSLWVDLCRWLADHDALLFCCACAYVGPPGGDQHSAFWHWRYCFQTKLGGPSQRFILYHNRPHPGCGLLFKVYVHYNNGP